MNIKTTDEYLLRHKQGEFLSISEELTEILSEAMTFESESKAETHRNTLNNKDDYVIKPILKYEDGSGYLQ
jgi:hypothetical protein